MKTVESRIAFSRFIFEDAEQCALQGEEEWEDDTRNSERKQAFGNLMRRKLHNWNKQGTGMEKCCLLLLVYITLKSSLSLWKRHWTQTMLHKLCWQVFSWFILRVLRSPTSCLDKVLLRSLNSSKVRDGTVNQRRWCVNKVGGSGEGNKN